MSKKLAVGHRELLINRLLNIYDTMESNFPNVVFNASGRNLTSILNPSGWTNDIPKIINEAQSKGWIDKLIEEARKDPNLVDQNAQAELKFILDSLIEDTYILQFADPLQACFADSGTPFINRAEFRQKIKNLRDSTHILVVNGRPGSGKTYSKHLIKALEKPLQYKCCYISLEEENPASYSPDKLATRINRLLSLPATETIPAKQTDDDWWTLELSDWLVQKINEYGQPCWLILDGLSNENLPQATKRLVDRLAREINNNAKDLRIILLDFPETNTLDEEVQQYLENEYILDIGQRELESFFQEACQQKNKTHPHPKLTSVVSQILGEVEKILGDEVERALVEKFADIPDKNAIRNEILAKVKEERLKFINRQVMAKFKEELGI
jgi:hypothetical protein